MEVLWKIEQLCLEDTCLFVICSLKNFVKILVKRRYVIASKFLYTHLYTIFLEYPISDFDIMILVTHPSFAWVQMTPL
jgi:hypothetical protein